MDCKAWTIWNFPPFNWIDPQNKRSLIEFWGKLSSCFQVSVNTHYFNYMMISIERVCKQPEWRRRQHTREALCTCLAFTFFFQDELHFPKAHQQGQGLCFCNPDFRGKLCLVPPFSQLSSSPAWYSFLRVSIASSPQSRTIFHTKPRLFVPRPENDLKTLTKMCWLRKLCCSEVKKQLPLGVYSAPLQSKQTLVSQSLQLHCKFWYLHGKYWWRYVEVSIRNMFSSEDSNHYLGSGAESWRQEQELTCQVSLPTPLRLHQAQRGNEAEAPFCHMLGQDRHAVGHPF